MGSRSPVRGVRPSRVERLLMANLLAERTGEACSIVRSLGRGFIALPPRLWMGSPSLFDLAPCVGLARAGARRTSFTLPPVGAERSPPVRPCAGRPTSGQWKRSVTMPPACSRPRAGNTGGQQPLRGLNSSEGPLGTAPAFLECPGFVYRHIAATVGSHPRGEKSRSPTLQVPDNAMPRQSACSGTATLTCGADLAGLAATCHKAVREQQRIVNNWTACDALSGYKVAGTPRLMGSSTTFLKLAPWSVTYATAKRPSDLVATFWPS